MRGSGHALTVRRGDQRDTAAVLELLEASMGWLPGDLQARFFSWKHRENPFGPSPAWVAVDDSGRVVGFRTFLRWEFVRDGERIRATRAVDTATHPDHQGEGVFSRLTLSAIDELRADGVAFIFNTPNHKSLPGYLKMGWRPVGRLPLGVRPASFAAGARTVRARTPADKWSLSCEAGVPARDAFADPVGVAGLLRAAVASTGLATNRTPAFLSWRYGFEPLAYRAVLAGNELAEGVAVFRLRRRGPATEATITEVLVPATERRLAASLCRRVLRESGADYALRLRTGAQAGFLPLPRQGPLLVARGLAETPAVPTLRESSLTLGDIELF